MTNSPFVCSLVHARDREIFRSR